METHNLISQPLCSLTDQERHDMTMNALITAGRPYDYESIVNLLSPPPDITNFGTSPQFKNIKVGIIGGGLAGLSAAFELRKLGFDITVFEAHKDRIGGRINTYYFNNDSSLYGELGAMRIPASHETVWHYIKLFNLHTAPFIQASPNALAYIRGVRTKNTPSNIMQNIYPKFQLTYTEYNTPWPELYKQVSRAALSSIPPFVRPELLQVLPKYSPQFEKFTLVSERRVLESYGLKSGAINLITNLLPGVNAELNSGYEEELIEDYALNLTNLYQIIGGMVNLPLAFYKALTSQYPKEYRSIPQNLLGNFTWKSGHWITGIYKSDSGEKLILKSTDTFEDAGVNETFDYVICTIPLSELRKIDIKPLFRSKKMQAIKEINYIDAQKTLFLCKEPFWEKGNASERIVGGSSVTDLLIESIVYPSSTACPASDAVANDSNFNKPSVFIASYNADLDAVRLGTMDEEERFALIKRQVEEVHGLPKGYLNSIAADFKTVDWNREIRFSGAYARFLPEQRKDFFYELSIPEYNNRVFFAGEHTSPNHAWMQGALHSGMLAANNIVYYHRKQHGQ